jgi:hypothetical protein
MFHFYSVLLVYFKIIYFDLIATYGLTTYSFHYLVCFCLTFSLKQFTDSSILLYFINVHSGP